MAEENRQLNEKLVNLDVEKDALRQENQRKIEEIAKLKDQVSLEQLGNIENQNLRRESFDLKEQLGRKEAKEKKMRSELEQEIQKLKEDIKNEKIEKVYRILGYLETNKIQNR